MQNRDAYMSEIFNKRFGELPILWARAPGRVDLMGSHTDYNMGHVMTMTIDRDTWIAARPRSDGTVTIYSLNMDGGGSFELDGVVHDPVSRWTDYVRGVAYVLKEAGYTLIGFDGLIHSEVPFGSGLSSSAALEMAAIAMFQMTSGLELDPVEAALLGQKAENCFVGVNCGILDQYSSAMGRQGCALLLDCRELTSLNVSIDPTIEVVICDTRATRNLTGSEYDERRAQCEEGVRLLNRHNPRIEALRDVTLEELVLHEQDLPPVVARRCRFIIEEDQRVLDMAEALSSGDRDTLRDLLSASYVGARDLYEIGAPPMEAMMDAMLSAPGVIAARQAGAGFGGCMVALVEGDRTEDFTVGVQKVYALHTGIEPKVYPVRAAQGAGALQRNFNAL